MEKEEIKDYLKKIYELEAKLTGEDKETYTLLIYGYNQCAKLLNETEQQCKKQKEVIDKAINDIDLVIELIKQQPTEDDTWILSRLNAFKIILKEVSK